jgi:glycosyltransferase involved in cell wall biosynthesis
MKKARLHPGVYTAISDFGPDVILFHGLCGGELLTVAKYKKNNPDVKFYADSHADANNSAGNFVSKKILHSLYYGRIIRMALPYIDKILCVSLETKDFIREIYDVPDKLLEFYPLGGTVFSDDEYYGMRVRIRAKLGLSDDDVLIVQAGKLEKRKKVIESLQAFNGMEFGKMKLVLIGSVNDEIKIEFERLVAANDSVSYLGWLDSPELMAHLCAADLYLQPGSQSAIMQNSLCLRCPVAIADVPSHKPFLQGNGWAINASQSISAVFADVASNKRQLIPMAVRSLEIARIMLDYRQLAARLYV